MSKIILKPIGIIHTPYKSTGECPRQSYHGKGIKGSIVIYPQYEEGLTDLDGFSHLILIWHFHKSDSPSLTALPPGESKAHGVFATRSPHRPNGIGLTVVKLVRIDGATLHIEDPDMVDGTPLLDIKPYVLPPDTLGEVKRGWLDKD